MKRFLPFALYLLPITISAQTVSQKLQKAFQQFESDSQLKHAISSLYVIEAATGQLVFDKNSQVGMAGASTQKIITAATAFEVLGKDYRYKTKFYIFEDSYKSYLLIKPSGDPTFGSWRWEQTNRAAVISRIYKSIQQNRKSISWPLYFSANGWNTESIPDGWIWQDIGNYYGAGAEALNWGENQFDVVLKSGEKIGDPVKIVRTKPEIYSYKLSSNLSSAAKGSGDNAYAYFPVGRSEGILRGTIPINEESFSISVSMPSGKNEFESSLIDSLQKIIGKSSYVPSVTLFNKINRQEKLIYTHYSPTLDSIIYWFLKKSINLYGEALIKTLAYEKQGFGSTDSGVAIVKKFWKDKGLDEDELNIYDGSGLSPLNRITTHAQAEILKYAKTKEWFSYFYDALPEYNGMKMKSGTISDVKGFCGYQRSKDGKEYIFSFLVNNYRGKTSGVMNKMYKVLDELK